MVKYTLYYFQARARAETIRLVFAAAGVPFEDKRLEYKEEWPAFKPKTATGTLPVLEVDGQMITESIAIARFVARETGLAGKTSLDQAEVDAIVDTLTELRNATLDLFLVKDFGSVPSQSKVAEMESALQEKVSKNMTLVEGQLNQKKEQSYLQGEQVTWADLHFYAVVEVLKYALPDVLKSYPLLQGLEKRVAELPGVAAYLKNRPPSTI